MNKTGYLRYVYQKLLAIFPEKPWNQAIASVNKLSPAPVFKTAEHYISYGLFLWGEATYFRNKDTYEVLAMHEALYCCHRALKFCEQQDKTEQEKFIARFKGAFKNVEDMRALMFEVFMFDFLSSRGSSVISKDNDNTNDTYDYLLKKGDNQLQLECKSLAYDKGLTMTPAKAQELALGLIGSKLQVTDEPHGTISILSVNIQSQKFLDNNSIAEMVKEISLSIQVGEYSKDEYEITLDNHCDVEDIEDIDSWVNFYNSTKSIALATIASIPQGKNNRLVVEVSVGFKNSFWRLLEDRFRKASNQLNSCMPSIVALHFSNLDSINLVLENERFDNKIVQLFRKKHINGVLVLSNLSVYEQEQYPYFYFMPKIKLINNPDSIYEFDESMLL